MTPDLSQLPAAVLGIRPPLAVAFAVASAISDGVRVVYPPEQSRYRRCYGGSDIELVLPKGYDRHRLKKAGFVTASYPHLRRMFWSAR